jgi:hypothetical protein
MPVIIKALLMIFAGATALTWLEASTWGANGLPVYAPINLAGGLFMWAVVAVIERIPDPFRR